jgi:hypothetical protein
VAEPPLEEELKNVFTAVAKADAAKVDADEAGRSDQSTTTSRTAARSSRDSGGR